MKGTLQGDSRVQVSPKVGNNIINMCSRSRGLALQREDASCREIHLLCELEEWLFGITYCHATTTS